MLLSTFEFETNERSAKFCSPSPTNQRVTAVHIFCFGLFLFLMFFFKLFIYFRCQICGHNEGYYSLSCRHSFVFNDSWGLFLCSEKFCTFRRLRVILSSLIFFSARGTIPINKKAFFFKLITDLFSFLQDKTIFFHLPKLSLVIIVAGLKKTTTHPHTDGCVSSAAECPRPCDLFLFLNIVRRGMLSGNIIVPCVS